MRRELFAAVFVGLCCTTLGASSAGPECPRDMVLATRGVCIDRYEWPNEKGVRPLVGATALPTDYDARAGRVLDADTLCKKVNKRVCTRDEWVSACLYRDSVWPDGKRPEQGSRPLRCNNDKGWRTVDENKVHSRSPREFRRLDGRDPAGSRRGCLSDSGAFDMVGNTEEWVRCKEGRFGWCLMGRFWSDPQSCSHTVTVHSPYWHYYETGFRCCLDLE